MGGHATGECAGAGERHWLIVPAAGSGRRMGADVPKQYLRIKGRSILELTVERLHALPEIARIVLVLDPGDAHWRTLGLERFDRLVIAEGGAERLHSVRNGLRRLQGEAGEQDWVLVHDAVRPCVSPGDIRRLMRELRGDPVGGLLAAPVKETVKQGSEGGAVEATLDRGRLWLAATPQMFRHGLLRQALDAAVERGLPATDEAAALEAAGYSVKLVRGRADNIKITHPEDLRLAEFLLGETED